MANTIINSARLQPYNEKNPKPFVFVSYSHNETVKVEGVLRCMQRAGIRFWYDQQGAGIGAGSDWRSWVIDRLEKSSMFLCFLANGVEQRREVLIEIEDAIRRHEKDPGYQVLFIFLEKMPARVFSNVGMHKIETFIRETQFINYDGVTDKFIDQLMGEGVFPDALIREEALDAWRERSAKPLVMDKSEVFPENSYIYPTAFPEKDDEKNFFKVKMDQMDPDSVCLICLDNQWCPPELYNEPMFWERGLLWEEGKKTRTRYQTREVYRALLHHRQIVINRAFLYNSQVFPQWYDQIGDDYQAFCELLKNGTLLVYLTNETAPYDRDSKPSFDVANYEAWGEICEKIPVYCVRMDWIDEETNRLKVEQLLFHRFENFCLTMTENNHLRDDIAEAFEMDEKQKRDFAKIWMDVQTHAAMRDREEYPIYTRDRFYQKFLVRSKTKVSEGILDIHKAFAPELKEIVDMQYGVNLPESLGIRAIYPTQGTLKDFYRSGRALEHRARELSKEELSCAIGEFWPDFMKEHVLVDFPEMKSISLNEVVALRGMDEWKAYMRTVSNGRKRAHLQEVDFYDISFVWGRFYQWLSAAKMKGIMPVKWNEVTGAVSIIYRLGNEEIITIYHADSNEVTIRTSRDPEEMITKSQDHTVLITIDYVCSDILLQDHTDNFMLSEHRLFEGMTKDKLSEVRDEIISRLQKMEGTGQVTLCWKQKTPEERHIERKYREKSKSNEWRSYVELLQKNPSDKTKDELTLARALYKKVQSGEWKSYLQLMKDRESEFSNNRMLTIITDLNEICRYEVKHPGVMIGVRYQSPYSILVVDLVRDSKGNVFSYERTLPTVADGAVVCIPIYDGKYVLIEQFRHALRGFQLSFPRGYAEPGLNSTANAAKELEEELGVNVQSIQYLGDVVADSGANGNKVHIYRCNVSKPTLKEGYEGIKKLIFLSPDEMKQSILEGRIDDGYTLSALELCDNNMITDARKSTNSNA